MAKRAIRQAFEREIEFVRLAIEDGSDWNEAGHADQECPVVEGVGDFQWSPLMAIEAPDPPLTEPLIVPCLFATGAGVERTPHSLRLVFWVHTPNLGGEAEERRIVARLALPLDAAHVVTKALTTALRDRGH